MKCHTKERGFSLLELIVVMSIILILLSLLMPALWHAMTHAEHLKRTLGG